MSKPVYITADSTCDLTPALLERFHVKTIPLHIVLGEENYLDGVDFKMCIRDSPEIPSVLRTPPAGTDGHTSYGSHHCGQWSHSCHRKSRRWK